MNEDHFTGDSTETEVFYFTFNTVDFSTEAQTFIGTIDE